MLNNDLIKQWTEMNQSAMDALKYIGSANIDTITTLMDNQFSSKQAASLMQAALASLKDTRELNTNAFSSLMQQQLSMIDLNGAAESMKALTELSHATMQKFVEQQTTLSTFYMESSARYMEELKRARTPEDVLGAQMELFNEIQNKMKDNAMLTLETLEALKTGMRAWAEKSIEITMSSS
jgi:hypothetical protein